MSKIYPKRCATDYRERPPTSARRSRALVGDTNTVAVATAGAPTEVTQTTNKRQIDKAIAELKDSNEAFINELSNDLKTIITELTGRMSNLKTEIVSKISSMKNDLGKRLHSLEAKTETCDIQIDHLVKGKTEMEKQINKLETETEVINNGVATLFMSQKYLSRYVIDCFQFFIVELCGGITNTASFEAIKETNLTYHNESREIDKQETRISNSYWPAERAT